MYDFSQLIWFPALNITILQSSNGTLLIDGEARMKAPLLLELALQK
jgi:hypothetical protein